jgi:uncharacterized membrane protein
VPTPPRRHWLDWQRGIAVLLMVEVHVLDAWLDPGVHRTALHHGLQMLGGLAAPAFLFMAGLSLTLADAALAKKGVGRRDRVVRLLRRAAWLLGVALLFRLGEYVLGGMWRVAGGWRDLLRVDILNVIAVSLALAVAVAVAPPRRAQLPLSAGLALAIALVTPPLVAWPHEPGPLLDYLLPPTGGEFALVNWSAFAFAGAAMGRVLQTRDRPLLTLGVAAALFVAGFAGDRARPFYANQDFWRASPWWLFMRLGAVVAMSGALQLAPAAWSRALAGLSLLGRHSLLGYMASVELTYGLSTQALQRQLDTRATLVGIVATALFTAALALGAERIVQPWVKARRSRSAASS